MAALRILASGLDHPEGVAWHPDGYLVAGGEAGTLYRVDPASGDVSVLTEAGGAVLGIAIDSGGRLYWCDHMNAEVRRFDPRTAHLETWSTGAPDRHFRVPNFPVFDAAGRLYVSESGSWPDRDGAILVIEPDGATRVASTEPAAYTNGLAIDPAGRFLHVAETSLPGVSRLPILPDGGLGPRELVLDMPRTVPDGLAFAADGTLLIACFRPDAIYRWDGTVLAQLAEDWSGLILNAPTNICFFGEGLGRLAAANIGFRHLTEVEVALTGAPLHHPDVPG